MLWATHVAYIGEIGNVYKMLFENFERKLLLWVSRFIRENIIKMYLTDVMIWTTVIWLRDQWGAFVTTIINFRDPWNPEFFLTCCATVSSPEALSCVDLVYSLTHILGARRTKSIKNEASMVQIFIYKQNGVAVRLLTCNLDVIISNLDQITGYRD
jgi:hypothetical protein